MSMRIGTVDGKTVKRVRKNSDGTIQVQPVRKEVIDGVKQLVNDGEQFIVAPDKFIKGRI
jgi:hypothetical protein